MSEIPKPPIALSVEGFGKYVDGHNEELVASNTVEQGSGRKLVREEWHVTRFRVVADADTEITRSRLLRTSPEKELPSERR